MTASSHKNFRLRGIPLEYETRNEVCSLIQQTLALEPSASPTVYSLAFSPTDQSSKIATISFPSIPESLSDRSKDEWTFQLSQDDNFDFSKSLVFDTHFAGFTPFQRTSDNDCHVDVIAVCGLGGHALGSFKEKNGRFVWIRDALPSDIPNARILTYGYNSQLVESRSFQSLTDLARALQVDLEDIRDPNQRRSILFIGHSLGGLVIKETVRILKEEPLDADSSALNSICGFAFFGVPHRGLAIECLVPLVKDYPNRALLESLNKNSPLLERLQVEFGKISQASGFFIVSFYETERSPTAAWVDGKWEVSGPSEVLVEVFSATCGCQKQHPINRNHSEMVKYSGVHDQLYRRVIVSLRPVLRLSRERPGIGGIGGKPQGLKPEHKCLRSLSFPEQEHRYSEISYAHDTCEWLLDYPQYQAWMNKSQGLFWIKGCPGTGKSVLMKFAVDMMNRRKSGELVVSFFIHGRGVNLQRTPLGILRSLLESLLRSFPVYLSELTERFQDQQQRYGSYEQKNGWRWNEKELEKLLFKLLIEGTKSRPVVMFIDALDECGEEYAKSLLGSFKNLMRNAEREGSLIKICFSSRHFPILGHETMLRVYVEEKNDKDIRLVIEGLLREIQPDEKRHQIENEILLKAHGGFQWAILITNMVIYEDAIGAKTEKLLEMISAIPPDLDELYNVIIRGATKDMHKQMKKLFQWVLFAERPLSAQELREALATDKDMTYTTVSQLRSHGNWSDSVSQFETRVRHISRGLVEFQDRDVYEQYEPGGEEWNREAQFIHQSAADFVAQKFLTLTDGESMTGSSTGPGHYEISRSFLKYLTLEEILDAGGLSRKELSATFPLMPYGVAFVLRHVRAVEAEGIPQTDLTKLIQWDHPERLKMLEAVWRTMDPESTHAPRGWPFVGATHLHVAVAFGSASLLSTLLQKDIWDFTAQDGEGNTPLHLALRENNQDLALMILERSRTWQTWQYVGPSSGSASGLEVQTKNYLVHVRATNHDDETPLALALSVRADKAIRSLIDAGAEIKNEKSLVFYAISTEDKALLSRLIEAGADLAGAVFFTIQCLHQTSQSEDTLQGLLRDLLKAGAGTSRFVGSGIDDYDQASESDVDDSYEEEAIFLASRYGRLHDINLLLSYGFPATLKDDRGSTPLVTAMQYFNFEAAKILLRASPETVLWKDNFGDTILDRMIEWDMKVEEIQLLIDESCGHLTPQLVLTSAVDSEDLELAKHLFDEYGNTIQLGIRGEDGDALLRTAVRKGDGAMAKLLLDFSNIDINIPGSDGNSPFHIAVYSGNLKMAKLLLDTGKVEISQRDGDGYTSFLLAIINKDEAMIKLILESGKIDISRQNIGSQTLFWWTIKHGTWEMINLLLQQECGVDINQRDDRGQTPLLFAIEEKKEEIVQLLLCAVSIDVHVRNGEGRTPLWWATENRNVFVIQCLLASKRFNINQEDKETIQRMTLWAIESGKDQVIHLLLGTRRFGIHNDEEILRKMVLWAIEFKKDQTIQFLLQSTSFGIDKNEEAVRKLLWWAIEHKKDHVVQLLVESGRFDIYQEDEVPRTTVRLAIERSMAYTVQLFLMWRAINLQTEDDEVVRKIFWVAVGQGNERLIHLVHDSGRFGVNTKDRSGKTPLMHTTEACAEESLKVLLKTGKADVQAIDNEGNTSLSIAVRKGYKTIADLLSSHIPTTDMVMRHADG
ncbi:hypothetical protein FBEOM_7695 [Fusarium beomiforme]|uniref:Nephrocystin 3-like N-terminal domain-containing protein n=1 Tax=Fusarium beomiforme TaxID=44412 RepID=A0A9P5DV75_9HYPO|nr:hypothetical protein FBEOM_7695 [Fusarium beomiforme]